MKEELKSGIEEFDLLVERFENGEITFVELTSALWNKGFNAGYHHKALSQHDVMPSLRCIWNGKTDDTYKITIGKTYPLVCNHEHYYAILNDDGDVDTYNKSCFELVSNEV